MTISCNLIPINSSDIPELLEMIKALGESDGHTNIKVSEQDVKDNILNDSPVAFAKFICYQQQNVGFILHSWKWSPFSGRKEVYMQCIYIKPEFQGLGIGKIAMQQLIEWAKQQGSTKIEWLVLKENQQANHFYDSIGAQNLEALRLRRLTL